MLYEVSGKKVSGIIKLFDKWCQEKDKKTVWAYKLNDSDLVGADFMSYQQWAETEKLHRETLMKKSVSISLLLHLSLDEGRNER